MNETNESDLYNGWTNYPTWRVNHELVDGIDWVGLGDFESLHALSEYIKEHCQELITESGLMQVTDGYESQKQNIAVDYALAFLDDVNWYEIAKSVQESYDNVTESEDGGTGVLVGSIIKE